MTVYLSLKIVSHSFEMNPRWEFLYIGHCPFIACSVCDKRIIMFLCLDIAQQTDIIYDLVGFPTDFQNRMFTNNRGISFVSDLASTNSVSRCMNR